MRDALNNAVNTAGTGWEAGKGRFLIDGFPRKMDQALEFDKTVSIQGAFFNGTSLLT
jgi:UMP-CMP kinase